MGSVARAEIAQNSAGPSPAAGYPPSHAGPGRREKGEKLWVALILASFLVAGLFVIKPYLTGSDQVSYISIAQKYARGQFGQAVNGYWSPLFSWLLAPLLLVRIEPVVAYKILTLLASVFLIFSFHLLSRLFSLTFRLRMVVLLAFAPALFFCFFLIDNGPDILLAGLITCSLVVLFDPRYLSRSHSGLWFGVFGAAAFVAKSYAFFFFVGLTVIFHLYLCLVSGRGAERRKAIGRFLTGLAVFLCLCAPWVSAISLKYHRLMISSSSRINLYMASPTPKEAGEHPLKQGLFPPPNPTAVSSWEDPTVYEELYRPWSPFQSRRDFSYWFRHTTKVNSWDLLKIFFSFSFLSPLILLAGLVLALSPQRHRIMFLSGATLILYTSGYFALFVIGRYLIIDLILIVLMGAYLLNLLSRFQGWAVRASVHLLTGVFLISFFLLPYQYSAMFREGRKRFIITPDFTDIELYRISRTLRFRSGIPPGARIASNFYYSPTHLLAGYLGLKYYGVMTYNVLPEVSQAELRKFDIDYVFYWSQDKLKDHFLASSKEITRGKTRPLWVYSLKERAFPSHWP